MRRPLPLPATEEEALPIKDPEKRKEYHRQYKRAQRAGVVKPGQTLLAQVERIQTAQDILDILSEQVAIVRTDHDAKSTEAARAIGYLCAVALKACETATLEARIAALEEAAGMKEVSDGQAS